MFLFSGYGLTPQWSQCVKLHDWPSQLVWCRSWWIILRRRSVCPLLQWCTGIVQLHPSKSFANLALGVLLKLHQAHFVASYETISRGGIVAHRNLLYFISPATQMGELSTDQSAWLIEPSWNNRRKVWLIFLLPFWLHGTDKGDEHE